MIHKLNSFVKNMTNLATTKPRYYILVADEKTWKVALEKCQWGFSQKNVGLWNTTNDGDFVAFYVTTPIKKIIGFGKVIEKFISEDILWPDEKLFKKSLWMLRLQFKPIHVVKNWKNGVDSPKNMMLNTGRKVIEKNTFDSLASNAEKKWKALIRKNL